MPTKSEFFNLLCEWYRLNAERIMRETTPEANHILLTERAVYAEIFHIVMETLPDERFIQ